MTTSFPLNPEQKRAVFCIDKPLLVLAGAGSGKTRVITEKIAYLIETCGIKPYHIAAVTFTNKAAKEMQHRLTQRLQHVPHRGLSISTFHTLGLKILRSHPEQAGLGHQFSIYDETDCIQLVKSIEYFQNFNKDAIQLHLQHISQWKNQGILPAQARSAAKTDQEAESAVLFEHYEKHLRTYQAVDFDDLIALPLQIFRRHPEILARWQEKIRYILVDEYQDTNTAQYELVRLLSLAHPRFTVVGDDDQSIYSWRGAQPENLLKLKEDFLNLEMIKLEQNYRSTNTILQAANHLIQQNAPLFPKSLWSEHPIGERIRVLHTTSEQDEAEQVTGDILKLHALHHIPLHHFAILYRGNYQSQLIEQQLQLHRLPYQISGGTSIFSRTEIRDVLSYLRVLANPKDDAAFLRILNTPKRGIGSVLCDHLKQASQVLQKSLRESLSELAFLSRLSETQGHTIQTLHRLLQQAEMQLITAKTPSEWLHPLLNHIEYPDWLIQTSSTPAQGEKRWQQVEKFILWMDTLFQKKRVENPEYSLPELLNMLLLIDQLDQQDQEASTDAIQLLTLHAAKGLEFARVYVIGFEENLLPHKTSIEQNSLLEERRLAYVGITRAKTHLTLSLARTRQTQGQKFKVSPSRFLEEIPGDLLKIDNPFEMGDLDTIQQRNHQNLAQLKERFQKK